MHNNPSRKKGETILDNILLKNILLIAQTIVILGVDRVNGPRQAVPHCRLCPSWE